LTTILQQLAAGDDAAVARCLDEYGGLVWDIACRYLGNDRAELEDAVQDVFLSVWMSAKRFDPSKGSEPAFVATIAHRRLTDTRRRMVTRKAGLEGARRAAALGALVLVNMPTAEDLERLGDDFAKLPEEERTALWMAISKGLSHREIAAATLVPVGTVKSRLRRAVLRLQEAWGLLAQSASHAEDHA
jgi:RNA polymerase sigma-70 factor (ECF subfamily)